MKIKTKLKLASVCVITFTFFILLTFLRLNVKEKNFLMFQEYSHRASQEVNNLTVLIHEYLLDPQEDTYQKIEANIYFLKKGLEAYPHNDPKYITIKNKIETDLTYLKTLLENFQKNLPEEAYSLEEKLTHKENILFLSRDVLQKTKNILFLFLDLSAVLKQDFALTHNSVENIVIFFLTALTAFILFLAFSFEKSFTQPIDRLIQYSQNISKGFPLDKIEFKKTDEISTLGQSFQEMTHHLKAAQENILKNERIYSLAEKITDIATWEYDLEKNKFYWSDNIKNVFNIKYTATPETKELLLEYIYPADKEKTQRIFQGILSGKITEFSLNLRIVLSNGKIEWIEWTGGKPEEDDNPTSITGIIRNITKRKNLEEELEKQRYYLLKAQAMGGIGTWDFDLIENTITWTNETYKIFEIPIGTKLNYKIFLNLVHPDDRKFVDQKWMSAVNQNEPYDIEHRIITNGKTKWIREKGELKFNEEGQCVHAIGFAQDITEKKKKDEQLRQSETRLRHIIENSTILFYSHAPDHTFTYLSPQCKTFFDCEPEEALISWKNFLTDNPLNQLGIKLTGKAIQTGKIQKPYELELISKKGRKFLVEVHEAPVLHDGKVISIVGSLTDITERKKTETLIQANEKRFKALFDNMSSGVAIYHPIENGENFNLIDFNKAAEKIESIKKENIIGKKITDVFPGVIAFGLFATLKEVHRTGQPKSFPVSFYKDERISGWRDNYIYKLPSGEIVALYNDITQAKKAEEELNLYRKHLEDLVEERTKEISEMNNFSEKIISTIPSALVVLDANLKVLRTNRQFIKLFNITEEKNILGKPLGKAIKNIHDKGTAQSSVTIHLQAFINSQLKYSVFEDSIIQEINPEKQIICRCYISEIPKEENALKDNTEILVALEDITTAKSLEQQLIISERLAATGRLAASIAHEINNPLQGMSTHLDLMKDGLPEDTNKMRNYEHVKANIKRISEIVGQLLNIYRMSSKEKLLIDVNELIHQVVSFIEYQSQMRQIQLKLKLTENLPKVLGWKQQIHQVLLNLVLNGMESIEGQGTLSIMTRAEEDTVIIKIKDTGKGMNKETAKHIFDPFFSTKKDTGVGLGLFVCNGLIKNHNGEIHLETKEGKGTAFTIKLKGEK